MASFFGEIIEPTTRAIFDDCSDDEETDVQPELQLSWSNGDENVPSVLDIIFVIHGRLSLAFAEAYLLEEHSSPVGEITLVECKGEEDVNICHHKSLPSRIYINTNIAMCLVSPTCPSDLGYEFTEIASSIESTLKLSPLLKISKKIIMFTNEPFYNFKAHSLNKLPPAFIRELKTSHNLAKDKAEQLPAPNFISGIPAGVMTWCQIFKKDGSAFICYSDQEKLDSITAKPFLAVFKKLQYNVIKNENPDFKKKAFYGKPQIIGDSSNIYM